jgi:hypothetical protein
MTQRMKKLMAQPKFRLAILFTVLIGLLVLNLTAKPVKTQNHEEKIAHLPEATKKRQAIPGLYGEQVGRPKWLPSGEDIFMEVSSNTSAEVTMREPEPQVSVIPPPVPVPVAPPLPFVAMAKFKSGEKSILYLRAGNDTIPVYEGDLLEQGNYKIESISEGRVSIRYLPMNHLHELNLSGLE